MRYATVRLLVALLLVLTLPARAASLIVDTATVDRRRSPPEPSSGMRGPPTNTRRGTFPAP